MIMKYICLWSLLSFAFLAGCVSAAPVTPTVAAVPSVTLTVTVAPATSTPVETEFRASKVEDILGWWKFSNQGAIWKIHFLANGTIRSGPLENPSQFLHGTFWFDGTVVRVDEPSCGPGSYEAYIIQRDGENYRLYFKVVEDPCVDRVREMTRGYKWVGPE